MSGVSVASDVVVLCWAVSGFVSLARARRLGFVVLIATALAAVAVISAQLGDTNSIARGVATVCAPLAMAASLHILLSLPDGSLSTRPMRTAAGLWYVVAFATGLYLAASARVISPWPAGIVWAIAIFASLPVVHARYASATASGRERVQGLATGVATSAIVCAVVVTLNLLLSWPGSLAATLVATTALMPAGLIVGEGRVARHIDRVLVHLLTALGLVFVICAIYLITLRGFGRAPRDTTGRELLWWSLGAAGLAAIINLGVRDRFARIATGLTYGAREAPDEVVRTFGSRLTRAIAMDELMLQLVESLRKTLTLKSAEIYTGTGEVLQLFVSVPDLGERSIMISGDERPVIARAGVSGNAWASVWIPAILEGRNGAPVRVAPISHAGDLLGIIVIARDVGAVSFREEDDRVLTELARQVGLAMHNAQLDTALQSSLDELRRQADELRASRARVVASGDAERRRVERNLHDGAQQHLVALAVNLRLAKDIATEDPQAAVAMLDELGKAVQDTIRELRELAHGIYPPLLVDSGLSEALRAVVNRSPLDIELATDGIGRYGGDIEAAIYFCCLEALQNAGKHAPNSRVTTRVWEESGGLLFEVSDDGPGFDVRAAKGGQGYVNMMDRLGAIGGAVRWESQIGHGTTIRGSVPIN